MSSLQVNLDSRSYPIHVQSGLIKKIPTLLSEGNHGQRWVIISQHNLMELFGFELQSDLKEASFHCDFITLPVGEAAKSLNEFSRVISQMIELGCDRSTTILALGGGVVGDVAGFVASTFMRGIDYFQVPTTLLAMVDSAIGGKTGINVAQGKNLVGAIYQPKGVFVDPLLLEYLPREETVAGLGEVLKYGAIRDRDFLLFIYSQLDNLDDFDFEKAIRKSCGIKADIVAKDEREGGLRRLLNFGHTIGHALEAHLGYGRIRHGEAVAYGMICAGWISFELGLLPQEDFQFLKDTIQKLPLPVLPFLEGTLLMPYIKTDKKSEKGVLSFVVLEGLGHGADSQKVTEDLIKKSLGVIQ